MNSVRILKRNLAAENSKFNIYFDNVMDSLGHEVPNYLIVEPKYMTENLVTGVGILPVFENKIGLIQIYRPALRDCSWEIPHGFVESGETNFSAAVRELMEETGLAVNSIRSLGLVTPDAGIIAARVHLFLAEGCVKSSSRLEELGIQQLKFFSVNEFECMISASKIQDSFTLSAWCQYLLLRKPLV